jgi:Transcription factor WhiB
MSSDDKRWQNEAICQGDDVELFFDKYEEDVEVRKNTDALCSICPVARICFASGVSNKAIGVWGGVYLNDGKISKEFNRHKNKQDWAEVWQYLTIDKE